MSDISVNSLAKSFGIDEIFKDVSFNLEENDKVGLIGLNGSGKTTLLNVLTGLEDRDDGEISIKNNLKIGYLKQNIHLSSKKNMYEECLEAFEEAFEIERKLKKLEEQMEEYASRDKRDKELLDATVNSYNLLMERFKARGGLSYNSQIRGMLKGMGFSEDEFKKEVDKMSGGEKSRLELGKLLLMHPDILFLDEPTNHLDIEGINFLESYLKDFKGSILVISHDRYFLDNVVNKIFLLENKKLYIYKANYTEFMRRRKQDLEVLWFQYENQQKEIARQKEIIERLSKLGGSKRKRGIAQSRSRQKLLDKMDVMDKPERGDYKMALKFTPKYESGEDVLKVKDLSKSFGDRSLFENISFNIYKGEKIGIIGGNGTGKTTLFKIIMKKVASDGGLIKLGDSVKLAYFDQEQTNLNDDNTVLDEIWDAYPKLDHFTLRSYLAKFMFFGDDIFKIVGDLSGGEKARVSLLKLMLSSANFLLMDEPTNHLDIDSKEVLEMALNSYEGTCLFISHDRYFLNKVSEKLLVLEDKSLKEYYGNFDYYQTKLKEEKEEDPIDDGITKTQLKKEIQKKTNRKKEERKLAAKIRNLEIRIEELEEKYKHLEIESYDPKLYEDHEKANEHHIKMEDLKSKINKMTEEWLSLLDD